MKLRTKYILFIALLHLTALVLSYYVFRENKLLFIAAEAVIILSVILSWQLFRQLLQPLKLLTDGAEAMKDKDFTVKFLPVGSYEMDRLILVYNQMMDALRTERTRQEQQHLFLEKLIYTSPTGIIILDFDNNIQQVNPKALQLLDVKAEDLRAQSIHTLTHPVFKQMQQLASGQSATFTINGTATYKLQKSHFIDRGFPRHFVMIEELTAEILAAEKKAYGKVIRMMAHEVNNSIGPVNSILQSALSVQTIWQNSRHQPLQHALQVAIDRNHNLNAFMRNFADLVRLPAPAAKSTDFHALLQSITRLMEKKAGEKAIRFTYRMDEEPFFIVCDAQQMEQVLINIIQNAIDAIETNGEIGFLLNRTSRVLQITDTGKGISEAASAQLFSPFFSTKPDGQGIGLTLIKEILHNHGFEFSLKNIREGLTAFTIRFHS
ncbi:sensor histidine kinase [Deminuibacter soli]|uniref:histidine kinase n=1 Tax=Deminuibacter soli TaxID=2291815 RepID=A0A3E1NKT9_9BACT|nr:ATP-binding protein [Deminuibacter soli]RFM28517.1 HAMP domain-containing protein [Deminuibacter soli]